MQLDLLFELSPVQALHDAWRTADPEPPLAVGGMGFGAYMAELPWGAIVAFVGLLVMTVGSVAIQLRKQYIEAEISIELSRRRAADPAPDCAARTT